MTTHTTAGHAAAQAYKAGSLGQLVQLGFDVTVFAPAAYQRHRL